MVGSDSVANQPHAAEAEQASAATGLVGEHSVDTAADMELLGERVGRELTAGDVVVLTGELGAGKTTFTRGLARALGVRGPVQSPTFVIARTHPSLVGGPDLVHVDAYRLGSADELEDLGITISGSVVVVEWGRGMAEDLADVWWDIEIMRPIGLGDGVISTEIAAEDLDGDAVRNVIIQPPAVTSGVAAQDLPADGQ